MQGFRPTPEMTYLAIFLSAFPRDIPFDFNSFYNAYISKYSKKSIKNEFDFMSIVSLALDTHNFYHYKVTFEAFENGGVEFTTNQNRVTNEKQFHELYYNSLETGEPLYLVIRNDIDNQQHSITENIFQMGFSGYSDKSKEITDTFFQLALNGLDDMLGKVPKELYLEHLNY
jgi:hypothetical protein